MSLASSFKHISVSDLHASLADQQFVILDIRDASSYVLSHIPGAIHLSNDNLQDFLRDADFDKPTLVCCYHGISSQQAADFLISQDFTDVYSLDGGFDHWSSLFPVEIDRGQ